MRLAITGAGVVTPIGTGLEEFCAALRAGRRSVSRLEGVPVPRGKDGAGVVTDPRFQGPDRGYAKAAAAVQEALDQARPDWGKAGEVALILSTIWGDGDAAERLYPRFAEAQEPDPELLRALRLFPNGSILASLGERFSLFGPRLVIGNACASGNIALGTALDLIRLGRCRAAVVVGVENLKLIAIWGAERAGFIGRRLRPFHRERDGSILGEGAGAMVLERVEDADPSRVLGYMEGFGCVCDKGAAAITLLEDGSGLRRSMGLAIADAGREPGEVDYINAHAPGTPLIDRVECKAVGDLFGARAGHLAVNASKSLTTHLQAASAIVEVIASLLQSREGFVHPNAELDDPDPELAVEVVGEQARPHHIACALSNACGGGGLNTSVVVTARESAAPRGAAEKKISQTVAITGLGVVSAEGFGPGSSDRRRPESDKDRGSGMIEWFDIHRWYPEETQFSYMNRAAQLAAAAAAIAIDDAGLVEAGFESDRVAVLAGTFLGGDTQASEILCHALMVNPDGIRPSMGLDHGHHLGAALVCRFYGFNGTSYTLTGSSVAGLSGVAMARDLLLCGRADAVVVIGFDCLDDPLLRAAGWLEDCLPPTRLGEGAGVVILERADRARKRRARRWVPVAETALMSVKLRDSHYDTALARRLSGVIGMPERVRPTGSPGDEPFRVAEAIAATTPGACIVGDRGSETTFTMAAGPMIDLVEAASSGHRSLVLGIDLNGVVAAVSLERSVEPESPAPPARERRLDADAKG
ncbi:MAG: hypothetical protein GY856_13160 [bacterium]|nr:hypothetical protein [bacterium]